MNNQKKVDMVASGLSWLEERDQVIDYTVHLIDAVSSLIGASINCIIKILGFLENFPLVSFLLCSGGLGDPRHNIWMTPQQNTPIRKRCTSQSTRTYSQVKCGRYSSPYWWQFPAACLHLTPLGLACFPAGILVKRYSSASLRPSAC